MFRFSGNICLIICLLISLELGAEEDFKRNYKVYEDEYPEKRSLHGEFRKGHSRGNAGLGPKTKKAAIKAIIDPFKNKLEKESEGIKNDVISMMNAYMDRNPKLFRQG